MLTKFHRFTSIPWGKDENAEDEIDTYEALLAAKQGNDSEIIKKIEHIQENVLRPFNASSKEIEMKIKRALFKLNQLLRILIVISKSQKL